MLNLYESEEFAKVSGPSLRPGGLEISKAMLDLCALAPDATLLDAGCGNGTTLAMLSNLSYRTYGLDISQKLLQKAALAAPAAHLHEGSAQKMPFKDGMFQAIISECVLSLMQDPAAMLRECHRVLQPEGFLCLSDLYIREYRACTVNADLSSLQCCLKGALTQQDLTALIRRTGFDVVQFGDCTKLLKKLTAELIFAHGSLQAFWEYFLGTAAARTVSSCGHKYGYYMLVARKKS